MPHATTRDGVKLYYEEAGSGTPVLFVHEFAADYRSWEPQMRYFSRLYRCITYCARGYPPSDVPKDGAAYTYEHFRDDVIAMLDHLKIDKAHIVGLSMGGYSALMVGLRYPERARSLTLAGTGSGSERALADELRQGFLDIAKQFESEGSAAVAKVYGNGPTRVPYEVKDPRGHREFLEALAAHDPQGSAHTMRNFQGKRPPVWEFEAELKKLAVPTLILLGDEDDPCIEPSIYLKQHIPTSGLAVLPKTGHTTNLEEPALFNATVGDFLARVDAGRWPARDPRSIRPGR
ncbi:MAG TPA: alpha/beta hydrolase [Xanthobacteraceae bacterium]|nr:alpha/beta hydrolase [Xanthobacteraceae bacterium]